MASLPQAVEGDWHSLDESNTTMSMSVDSVEFFYAGTSLGGEQAIEIVDSCEGSDGDGKLLFMVGGKTCFRLDSVDNETMTQFMLTPNRISDDGTRSWERIVSDD